MPNSVETKTLDEKTTPRPAEGGCPPSPLTERGSGGGVVQKGSVEIDAEKCKGCGLCTMACARGVLAMSEKLNSKGYTPAEVVKPERCTGCKLCALMCPDVAIKVYRKKQAG